MLIRGSIAPVVANLMPLSPVIRCSDRKRSPRVRCSHFYRRSIIINVGREFDKGLLGLHTVVPLQSSRKVLSTEYNTSFVTCCFIHHRRPTASCGGSTATVESHAQLVEIDGLQSDVASAGGKYPKGLWEGTHSTEFPGSSTHGMQMIFFRNRSEIGFSGGAMGSLVQFS